MFVSDSLPSHHSAIVVPESYTVRLTLIIQYRIRRSCNLIPSSTSDRLPFHLLRSLDSLESNDGSCSDVAYFTAHNSRATDELDCSVADARVAPGVLRSGDGDTEIQTALHTKVHVPPTAMTETVLESLKPVVMKSLSGVDLTNREPSNGIDLNDGEPNRTLAMTQSDTQSQAGIAEYPVVGPSAVQGNAWLASGGRRMDAEPSSPRDNTSPSSVVGGKLGDSGPEAPLVDNHSMFGGDEETNAGSMVLTLDPADVELGPR